MRLLFIKFCNKNLSLFLKALTWELMDIDYCESMSSMVRLQKRDNKTETRGSDITITLRTLWVQLQTNLPSKSSPLTLPTIPMLNPIAFIDFELNGISFNFPLIWAVSLCFGTRLSVPVLYAVWSLAAVSPEVLTSVNSNFEFIIPSVGILSMSNSKLPSFSLAPA